MYKVFNDVEDFMVAVDHTVDIDNKEQAVLYKDLIVEEYQEFLHAYFSDNDTEQLDACFDMLWVIIGFMKSRGWDCENSWEEGAQSNLSKIDPITGKVIKRNDGKVLKPEGWKRPDFSRFV